MKLFVPFLVIRLTASISGRLRRRIAMKTTAALRIFLVFLVVILFVVSSPSQPVQATEGSLLIGNVIMMGMTPPPKTVCVGDTVNARVQVKGEYPLPIIVTVVSNAGKVTPQRTQITGGNIIATVDASVEATNPGWSFITFGNSVNDAIVDWDFNVIDCHYRLLVQAHYHSTEDKVEFVVDTLGHGEFTVSPSQTISYLQGDGKYSVYVKPTYELTESDVACKLKNMLQGKNGFTISGSRDNVKLSLQVLFDSITLEGKPEIECKDSNDKQAAIAFLEGVKADPNQDLQLQNIAVSVKGGTYRFIFGDSGTGTVQVFVARGDE
jgi:hypothetical protein